MPDNGERMIPGPRIVGVERVLQIGEGRFLRGFVDWLLQQLDNQGLYDGRVVVAVPRPSRPGALDAWEQQGCRFTVGIEGRTAGQVVRQYETVSVIRRIFDPHQQWPEFLALARQADIDIVVSNTTEAGLVYQPEPFVPAVCPQAFPAKLTAYLYTRYQAFEGAVDRGLDIVPCELVEQNGDLLKTLVLRYADSWQLPEEFSMWVDGANRFYNTLVDSIVTTGDSSSGRGDDRLAVIREPYYRWVIAGPAALRSKWRFAAAGLRVDWVSDLTPFRTVKVRVLNGAHTAMAGLGLLAGRHTVKEVMDDPTLSHYVRTLLTQEVRPTLIARGIDTTEIDTFIADVLERFQNPFLHHQLADIQLNAWSKMRYRLLPTLKEYAERFGEVPPLLTLGWSAQVLWSLSSTTGESPEIGLRRRIEDILGQESLWGEDLTTVPGWVATVVGTIERIIAEGVDAVLAEY